MQMEETNLSNRNSTTLLTNVVLYKSHSKDFESSQTNLHSTPSTISSISKYYFETNNSHGQEEIPTTSLELLNSPRLNMNNYSHLPLQVAHHHLVVATLPVHPLHQTQTWVKYGLRDRAVFFTMVINGENTMMIIQNPNFLAHLIMEGMKLAMDNYVNHHWMENVLSSHQLWHRLSSITCSHSGAFRHTSTH